MPRAVKLTIIPEANRPPEKIEGVLEDDDVAVLESYSDYLAQLRRTRLGTEGMRPQISIQWKKGEAMQVASNVPTEDDLLALLHRLRPFLLEKEPTSFNRTRGLLGRRFDNTKFHALLRGMRDLYEGRVLASQYQVSVNDLILNSDRTFYDWLNGFEYHRDHDKRALLEAPFQVLGDGAKVFFLFHLVDKMKAIYLLGRHVEVVLGKRKRSDGQVSNPEPSANLSQGSSARSRVRGRA